jgi:beta-lactamase class D
MVFRLGRAGLLTGIIDGLFSSVLSVVFYDSTVTRLFQGVASTVIGREALEGGTRTALLGVLMHFGVAFGWSAVFLLLVMQWSRVRSLLASRYGVIKVAAVYGPFVWMVMSLAMIPLLTRRPPTIGVRWWIQFIGHFPFVGLPIVASLARVLPRPDSPRTLASGLMLTLTLMLAASWLSIAPAGAHAPRRECVMLQSLDGSAPYVSDTVECASRTAPASTFKIPHALIALDSGVISDALEPVKWDGRRQPFTAWERDHSLDSAMKSSVLWFFRRTAASIGRDRMRQYLEKFGYTSDTFDGDLTSFWLNGDLVVSAEEQLTFVRRLVRYELPVRRQHVDAVKASLVMPPGTITNASGTHAFRLEWPGTHLVRAKTGFATVGDEHVSWLVGHIELRDRQYVFVSRVRTSDEVSSTAAVELAVRTLNQRPVSSKQAPGRGR